MSGGPEVIWSKAVPLRLHCRHRNGTSTGKDPPWNPSCPAHQHTWAELLTLVGAIRHIAHDITMEPDDQVRRIRDAFRDYDQPDED